MLNKSTTASLVIACLLSETAGVRYRPPAGSVPWHKPAKRPCKDTDVGEEHCDEFDPETGLKYMVNYSVPNFGEDGDI